VASSPPRPVPRGRAAPSGRSGAGRASRPDGRAAVVPVGWRAAQVEQRTPRHPAAAAVPALRYAGQAVAERTSEAQIAASRAAAPPRGPRPSARVEAAAPDAGWRAGGSCAQPAAAAAGAVRPAWCAAARPAGSAVRSAARRSRPAEESSPPGGGAGVGRASGAGCAREPPAPTQRRWPARRLGRPATVQRARAPVRRSLRASAPAARLRWGFAAWAQAPTPAARSVRHSARRQAAAARRARHSGRWPAGARPAAPSASRRAGPEPAQGDARASARGRRAVAALGAKPAYPRMKAPPGGAAGPRPARVA